MLPTGGCREGAVGRGPAFGRVFHGISHSASRRWLTPEVRRGAPDSGQAGVTGCCFLLTQPKNQISPDGGFRGTGRQRNELNKPSPTISSREGPGTVRGETGQIPEDSPRGRDGARAREAQWLALQTGSQRRQLHRGRRRGAVQRAHQMPRSRSLCTASKVPRPARASSRGPREQRPLAEAQRAALLPPASTEHFPVPVGHL